MNYLAHILLSGDDRLIQTGNFIADAVKGNAYLNYPERVADGILLHRAIDRHTDVHPRVREAVRWLRPYFGRYSAVLLDVFFDYILASRFGDYSPVPLRRFARRFYFTMIRNRRLLPPRIRRFMWHFISTDRLSRYATPEGIRRSVEIMARVHRMDVSPEEAVAFLVANEDRLREVFNDVFTGLRALSADFLSAPDRRFLRD